MLYRAVNSGETAMPNCWAITAGEAVWVKRPHMLLYVEG